jgi:flagellar motor switch protein FliM
MLPKQHHEDTTVCLRTQEHFKGSVGLDGDHVAVKITRKNIRVRSITRRRRK